MKLVLAFSVVHYLSVIGLAVILLGVFASGLAIGFVLRGSR